MKMWVYIVRRVALLVPVIIGVMTITFLLTVSLPPQERIASVVGASRYGYSQYIPCAQLYGPGSTGNCTNPAWAEGAAILDLKLPIPVQWGKYVYNSLTGQWGSTDAGSTASGFFKLATNQPVTTVLSYYLPYTLELSLLSIVIILLIAIPLGNYSAVYRNRPIDQASRIMSFSGYALPTFLLGTLVLYAATIAAGGFASTCNGSATAFQDFYGSWPPPQCLAGGAYPSWIHNAVVTTPTGFPTVDAIIHGDWYLAWQSVGRMVLPALVIAYGSVAIVLRFVRNSMLEVMNLDFIRTARSKGVPESTVISRHAGRNSLNVTINVLGLTFAFFIGGFAVVESVFNLWGVGRILALSIQPQFDFGLIFGSTLLFTIIVVLANICVDIVVAYLDPRVRLG